MKQSRLVIRTSAGLYGINGLIAPDQPLPDILTHAPHTFQRVRSMPTYVLYAEVEPEIAKVLIGQLT